VRPLAAGHRLEVQVALGAHQVAELLEAEVAGIEGGVVLEQPVTHLAQRRPAVLLIHCGDCRLQGHI
jgi:hypothetical protein